MKLNLGCGSQVLDGWLNVDYALGARFAKIPLFRIFNKKIKLFNLDWDKRIYIYDLTKKFPWADSSVDIIYSSHALEHFSKEEGLKFLLECHRVLNKGSIIRIVVPDLRHYVIKYLDGQINADDFVKNMGVLYDDNSNIFKKWISILCGFPHKCMYDNLRLVEILNDIGFEASIRIAFDSDIGDIKQLELENRIKNAVIVEGRKL